jgi:hypothetical protein
MSKINERLITNRKHNNKSRITTNWHKHLHMIYITSTSCFIEVSLNVTILVLHRLKYPCDYRTNNCNPIRPGSKGKTIQATEGFCAYLKK